MGKLKAIEFDLRVYKILLQFHGKEDPLVIHFDTPSRRFYFSVIALIINEMKKQGKPGFIHIRKHQNILELLDKSLSGKHASEHADSMWAKIKMAWRHRLPDLETAALFKVLDRDLISPYEKGGKYRYDCSDDEGDTWANLFGYDENNKWRFKFAIDSVSMTLNDISVTLGDLRDNSAWQEFIKSLSIQPKAVNREKLAVPRLWKKLIFPLVAVLIIVAATLAIWNFYLRPAPPVEVASVKKMAFPLPDKPSIAVLPFENLSGESSQEYFSDGITESIITTLSNVPNLFVIDRNSTFTYKGTPVKVQKVAEELGVRNVLEGSVQKSTDRVRITAQLVDAVKGDHLWSETYDRDLKDIFALQDDITKKILTALQVKLTRGEQARVWAKGTDNLEAYLKYLQARDYVRQANIESNALAQQMAEEVISIDPKYANAYVTLARTHFFDVHLGSSKSPKESIEKAIELIKKALTLDDSSADAHSLLAVLYTQTRQHDKSVAEAERAVVLDPNYADAHIRLGWVLRMAGRPEEAIPEIKKAIRLNPFPSGIYYENLTAAFLYAGQCEKATATCEKALHRETDNLFAHIVATVAYSMCGMEKEARETAAGVLRINPKFKTKDWAKKLPFKNQADTDRYIEALQKVGLK